MASPDRPSPGAAQIGFWMATALVVGNAIGSGIFLLPPALARFGADNLSGWLLTGAGGITLGLVFAALSRQVPGAGGPYAYTRAAFGDLAGFTVAWGYWVSTWVGNAAIGTAAVGYAGELFPWMIATPLNTALATLGFVWALTLVNCAGIRVAGWVQSVTTVIKLLPLIAAIGLLVSSASSLGPVVAARPHFTLGGTAAVATLALWAMLGIESATIPADKVTGGTTTVQRATIAGTVVTVILSAAGCAAVLLLVPGTTLAASTAPFATLIGAAWGPAAAAAVSLFAATSALGALNGWILLQGELPRAMAADGLFFTGVRQDDRARHTRDGPPRHQRPRDRSLSCSTCTARSSASSPSSCCWRRRRRLSRTWRVRSRWCACAPPTGPAAGAQGWCWGSWGVPERSTRSVRLRAREWKRCCGARRCCWRACRSIWAFGVRGSARLRTRRSGVASPSPAQYRAAADAGRPARRSTTTTR